MALKGGWLLLLCLIVTSTSAEDVQYVEAAISYAQNLWASRPIRCVDWGILRVRPSLQSIFLHPLLEAERTGPQRARTLRARSLSDWAGSESAISCRIRTRRPSRRCGVWARPRPRRVPSPQFADEQVPLTSPRTARAQAYGDGFARLQANVSADVVAAVSQVRAAAVSLSPAAAAAARGSLAPTDDPPHPAPSPTQMPPGGATLLPDSALAGASVWLLQQLSAAAGVPLEIYSLSVRAPHKSRLRRPWAPPSRPRSRPSARPGPARRARRHRPTPATAAQPPTPPTHPRPPPLPSTHPTRPRPPQLPPSLPLDAPISDVLQYVFAYNGSFFDCAVTGVVQARPPRNAAAGSASRRPWERPRRHRPACRRACRRACRHPCRLRTAPHPSSNPPRTQTTLAATRSNFLHPHVPFGYTIVTVLPTIKDEPLSKRIWSWTQPFSGPVWAVIASSMVITAFSMYVFEGGRNLNDFRPWVRGRKSRARHSALQLLRGYFIAGAPSGAAGRGCPLRSCAAVTCWANPRSPP